MNDKLYRTKLSDGSYLEPSVEYPHDTKPVRRAEAALVFSAVILGFAFLFFIALKQGLL